MDTAEILRRVRRVEIKTSRLASASMSGAYHSVFKGRGMDFEELREYVPGDDVRSIDWNATARVGKPLVKLHREERDLTIVLALDLSASFDFGSGDRTKREFAIEVAATIAFSAIQNNDKVGLFLFTEDAELFIPPGKGRRHTLRIIRDMIAHAPRARGTDLAKSLAHLNRLFRRSAVVFLLTDFFHTLGDDARSAAALKALALTSVHHDLVCLHIGDERETALPSAGLLTLEDAETGELVELNTVSAENRERYATNAAKRAAMLKETMRKAGIDMLSLDASADFAPKMRHLFDTRRRRR